MYGEYGNMALNTCLHFEKTKERANKDKPSRKHKFEKLRMKITYTANDMNVFEKAEMIENRSNLENTLNDNYNCFLETNGNELMKWYI